MLAILLKGISGSPDNRVPTYLIYQPHRASNRLMQDNIVFTFLYMLILLKDTPKTIQLLKIFFKEHDKYI